MHDTCLHIRDVTLTLREEALAVQEEKVRISKKTMVKVSADLDAERAKTEATCQEYLGKMCVHTDCAMNTIDIEKMLGEKKVKLDMTEWTLLCGRRH
jgi:hypothetical protein